MDIGCDESDVISLEEYPQDETSSEENSDQMEEEKTSEQIDSDGSTSLESLDRVADASNKESRQPTDPSTEATQYKRKFSSEDVDKSELDYQESKKRHESPNEMVGSGKSEISGPPLKSFIREPVTPAFEPSMRMPKVGLAFNTSGILSAGPEYRRAPSFDPPSPGIFDDAEEDETFDFADYKIPKSPPKQVAIPPDLVDVILGSPLRSSSATVEVVKKETSSETQQGSRQRKQIKSSRKLLIAKKEKDSATEILTGKIDLARVLPEQDCRFLAQLWVFTLQQLERILNEPDMAPSAEQRSVRREVLEKLARSSFLRARNAFDASKTRKNKGKHSEDVIHVYHSSTDGHKVQKDDEYESSESNREKLNHDDAFEKRNDEDEDSGSSAMWKRNGINTSGNNSKVQVLNRSVSKSGTSDLGDDGDTIDADASVASEESNIVSKVGNIYKNRSNAAEAKLEHWRDLVKKWRRENVVGSNLLKEQFFLDGPLSSLLPICTQRFLASVPIRHAYDFLSLKKTETGIIVDMLRLWRRKCGLSDIGPLPLAKHLLGIGMRMETALGLTPHAPPETREWMGCPLVVLSGASKDFVVTTMKIHSATAFVERKTKDLSNHLVDWRIAKGLPPLKGTGKVAMISGWKAVVKEAIDVEAGDGMVLTDVDFSKEVETETPFLKEDKKLKSKGLTESKKQPKVSKKSRAPEVEAALHSTKFLSTLFKDQKIQVMASVGIRTAQELIDADKKPNSPLIQAVIKMRSKSMKLAGSVQPSSCVRLIYDWCQRVKHRLEELESRKMAVLNSKSLKPEREAKASAKGTSSPRKQESTNPFESLSISTKTFLATLGITSAEEFLSTRTTDIANEFVTWRRSRNMTVLKGLGAIASVSGWKAQVRKAATSVGLEEIASLTPISGSSTSFQQPKTPQSDKKVEPITFEKPASKETADQGVLFGMPRRKFAVRGVKGDNVYRFELSVRTSPSNSSKSSVYLTYLGGSGFNTLERRSGEILEKPESLEVTHHWTVPVLHDVSVELGSEYNRSIFSTLMADGGTIELGKYGVKPLTHEDDYGDLRKQIVRFVSATQWGKDNTIEADSSKGKSGGSEAQFTVFEKPRTSGKKKYYLHLREPIEKGQTVELRFLNSMSPSDLDEKSSDIEQRCRFQEQISELSVKDLKSLLDHVEDTVGRSTYADVHKVFHSKQDVDVQSLSKDVVSVIVSRRRMHWLAIQINEQIQKSLEKTSEGSTGDGIPSVATAPLWTSEIASKLKRLPAWTSGLLRTALKDEVELELLAEFVSGDVSSFSSTRKFWCPLAEHIFQSSVELLSSFLLELDSFCTVDKLVDKLCSLVSNGISKIKSFADEVHPLHGSKFADLVMTYRKETSHWSPAFPTVDVVLQTSGSQIYSDAMSLCDEPLCKPPARDNVRVVATRLATGSNDNDMIPDVLASSAQAKSKNRTSVVMQSVDDMDASMALLHQSWYVERQVLAVVHAALLSSMTQLASQIGHEKFLDVMRKLRDVARVATGDPSLESINFEPREVDLAYVNLPKELQGGSGVKTIYKPHSLQFFLGLVWPSLRLVGWRMEVSDLPSDVVYLPPGRNKVSDSRARILKQERARHRAKLSKRTNDLGLGYIPKRTKRLFVNTAAVDEDLNMLKSKKVSVKDVMEKFLSAIRSDIPADDFDSQRRAEYVVSEIRTTFNEVAPRLLYGSESDQYDLDNREEPSELFGCEYLMRFLLVLPGLMQQSDLSIQEIDDTMGVIKEIIEFVAAHHHDFCNDLVHVPREYYHSEPSVPQTLVARLLKLKSKNGHGIDDKVSDDKKASEESKTVQVIRPQDLSDLTDFIECVMSQILVCRATQEDVARKNRRIYLGFPGLVCKHCLGIGGEGKYFFSSIESLTTAATVIEKHVAKCPKVDPNIKIKMIQSRGRHLEQRKRMPQGAQGAYFARLWDRLRSCKASSSENNELYLSLSGNGSTEQLGSSQESLSGQNTSSVTGAPLPSASSEDAIEFKDHVLVMDYIQKNSPWNEGKDLSQAIDQYYNCLDYGGRIFNTDAMPLHFSSEWLLSKIAPRPAASARVAK